MEKINYKKLISIFIVMTMVFSNILTLNPIKAKAETVPVVGTYHGLKAEYYKSTSATTYDFATLVSTHADETINFYDNFTSTLKERTGQSEACAVRWTGKIEPKYNENYTFNLVGDNGFRLWIDGKLVIDHWVNDWEIPQTSAPITLKAGTKYDFKMEYFQATGGADVKLEWSSANQVRQVVPVDCLYQPEGE